MRVYRQRMRMDISKISINKQLGLIQDRSIYFAFVFFYASWAGRVILWVRIGKYRYVRTCESSYLRPANWSDFEGVVHEWVTCKSCFSFWDCNDLLKKCIKLRVSVKNWINIAATVSKEAAIGPLTQQQAVYIIDHHSIWVGRSGWSRKFGSLESGLGWEYDLWVIMNSLSLLR